MRALFELARFELRAELARPEAVLWIFVLPLVVIFLIGLATRPFDGSEGFQREQLERAQAFLEAELEGAPEHPFDAQLLVVREAVDGPRVPLHGHAQVAPALALALALVFAATGGALALVRARRRGLVARLAATALGRGTQLLGRHAGLCALVFLQLACAVAGSALLFGARLGPHPLAFALVLAAFAAFAAALGLLVGACARTEAQATFLGAGLANLLALLGGLWFPPEVAPPGLRAAMAWTPTGAARATLERLAYTDGSALAALPTIVTLAALSALVLFVASTRLERTVGA